MKPIAKKAAKKLCLTFLAAAGLLSAKTQSVFSVNAGVNGGKTLGQNVLYFQPVQGVMNVSGRNLFGTRLVGFDVGTVAFVPILRATRKPGPNEITSVTHAGIFMGYDEWTDDGRHYAAGINIGAAGVNTPSRLRIYSAASAKVNIGLKPGLDLVILANAYNWAIKPRQTSNPDPLSAKTTVGIHAGLSYNLRL